MSVILGHKYTDKIYLAADNRLSTPNEEFISDDAKKIIIINDCLAIACAGNYAAQVMFEKGIKSIKNKKAQDLRIEDVLLHLDAMYLSFEINKDKDYAKNILNMASDFIVSGKDQYNESCIYAVSYVDGKLGRTKTDSILFPPSDLSMDICAHIYVRNIKCKYEDFMQKTIKEIAVNSKVVSPSGDIWIYDIKNGKSMLEHFA